MDEIRLQPSAVAQLVAVPENRVMLDRVPVAFALVTLALAMLLISLMPRLLSEVTGSAILIVDRSTGEIRICTAGSCRVEQ
jgi:hypothetical protein